MASVQRERTRLLLAVQDLRRQLEMEREEKESLRRSPSTGNSSVSPFAVAKDHSKHEVKTENIVLELRAHVQTLQADVAEAARRHEEDKVALETLLSSAKAELSAAQRQSPLGAVAKTQPSLLPDRALEMQLLRPRTSNYRLDIDRSSHHPPTFRLSRRLDDVPHPKDGQHCQRDKLPIDIAQVISTKLEVHHLEIMANHKELKAKLDEFGEVNQE